MQAVSTGAAITEIIEAYQALGRGWVRIADIAKQTDLGRDEIAEAITELMNDDNFCAEPEPFGHRLTEWDRWFAPVIGGEARHLIRWGE